MSEGEERIVVKDAISRGILFLKINEVQIYLFMQKKSFRFNAIWEIVSQIFHEI